MREKGRGKNFFQINLPERDAYPLGEAGVCVGCHGLADVVLCVGVGGGVGVLGVGAEVAEALLDVARRVEDGEALEIHTYH